MNFLLIMVPFLADEFVHVAGVTNPTPPPSDHRTIGPQPSQNFTDLDLDYGDLGGNISWTFPEDTQQAGWKISSFPGEKKMGGRDWNKKRCV